MVNLEPRCCGVQGETCSPYLCLTYITIAVLIDIDDSGRKIQREKKKWQKDKDVIQQNE